MKFTHFSSIFILTGSLFLSACQTKSANVRHLNSTAPTLPETSTETNVIVDHSFTLNETHTDTSTQSTPRKETQTVTLTKTDTQTQIDLTQGKFQLDFENFESGHLYLAFQNATQSEEHYPEKVNTPGYFSMFYEDTRENATQDSLLLLAYFLSTDRAFRIQCSALQLPLPTPTVSDEKCFVQVDPTLAAAGVTKIVPGKIPGSIEVRLTSALDVETLSKKYLLGNRSYSSFEKNEADQSLMELSCTSDDKPSCKVILFPKTVLTEATP